MAYDYGKERQEAIFAGRQALRSLHEAQDCLDSARNWGVFDLLGGGLLSSLVKHSRMDKAQQCINEAKSSLYRFERELRDLDRFESINLDTRDLLGFADVLFDGLLADALMQRRINEARNALEQTIRRVEEILRNL